jgi:hypothetical protein
VAAFSIAAPNPTGHLECPSFFGVTSYGTSGSGNSWYSWSSLDGFESPLAFAFLFLSLSSISLTPKPAWSSSVGWETGLSGKSIISQFLAG